MKNATLTLVCAGALARGDKPCDLAIELVLEEGQWSSRASGIGETFNAMVHPIGVRTAPGGPPVPATLDLAADIHPDPWVPGGKWKGTVELAGTLAEVRYAWRGVFEPTAGGRREMAGEGVASALPPFVANGAVVAGMPGVLSEFRASGPSGLLADFSYAGLPGGRLPAVPPREFRAVDFGAQPDSGRDATGAIQAAVDACLASGGGVVVLPAGRLEMNLDEPQRCVEIGGSNIVIRGAGSGLDGTLLYSHTAAKSPEPQKMWQANEFPRFFHAGPTPAVGAPYGPPTGERVTELREAARGSLWVEATGSHPVVAGQTFLLVQREDAAGSLGKALSYPCGRLARGWLGEGRELVRHYVRVERVDGPRLLLAMPLAFRLESRWRPALHRVQMVRGVGIESMRLSTAWDGVFDHHSCAEHDNGWDHIRFDGVEGGFVRDIVHESCTTSVGLAGCFGCLVEDCRITGNPAHNGFGVVGASTANLLRQLDGGRAMHAFAVQGTPVLNAFVDCEAAEPAGVDLHGSVAIDTLFDRLVGCVNVGGGSGDAVPPRHGPGLVFWNWRVGSYNPYRAWRRFSVVADCGEMAGFIAVGVHGKTPVSYLSPAGMAFGDGRGDWGWVASLGRRVNPSSLYAFQAEGRAGEEGSKGR